MANSKVFRAAAGDSLISYDGALTAKKLKNQPRFLFKGTVSRDYNGLKVVWLDTRCLVHESFDVQ